MQRFLLQFLLGLRFLVINSGEGVIAAYDTLTSASIAGHLVWEYAFFDGAYPYHFSNTLSGSCPAVGSGSFTLLSDGTLNSVHNSPMFTTSGVLSQRLNIGSEK